MKLCHLHPPAYPLLFLMAATVWLQLCAGCATADGEANGLALMRAQYERATHIENTPLGADAEGRWRRRQSAWNASLEFWSLYAEQRQRTGPARALSDLRQMINDLGLATALIFPVNGDLRRPAEDALIDSLVLKPEAKTTAYLAEVLAQGHRHELTRVNYFRQHADRG